MNRLPIAGLLALVLLVVSGYVTKGTAAEEAVATEAAATPAVAHPDPHVGYYQQHLIALGVR